MKALGLGAIFFAVIATVALSSSLHLLKVVHENILQNHAVDSDQIMPYCTLKFAQTIDGSMYASNLCLSLKRGKLDHIFILIDQKRTKSGLKYLHRSQANWCIQFALVMTVFLSE